MEYFRRRKWLFSIAVAITLVISLMGVQIGFVPESDSQESSLNTLATGESQMVVKVGMKVEASSTVNYVCDGVDDNVQFQAALNALPAVGGRIEILSGNYDLANLTTVTRAIDNVLIIGVGQGTYITCDGVTPIFTAGGDNWIISNLSTDAGSIDMGATTDWMWTYVDDGTFYAYRSPYGQSVVNDLTVEGHIAVGGSTVSTLRGILYGEIVTNIADSFYGVYSAPVGVETAGATLHGLYGMIVDAHIGAANTQNWTAAGSNVGLVGLRAMVETDAGSAGTVNQAAGVTTELNIIGSTVTTGYGLFIKDAYGGGTITNQYGIYMQDINYATTNNYAIYTQGGWARFGDNTAIGDLGVPTNLNTLRVADMYTNATDVAYGINSYMQAKRTDAATALQMVGAQAYVTLDSTNTQNWTATQGLRGFQAVVETEAASAGTLTGAVGFQSQINAHGATITNAYNLYLSNGTGVGTITNQYGLYIEGLTKGATNDYAIYTNAGKIHLGDDTTLERKAILGEGVQSLTISAGGAVTPETPYAKIVVNGGTGSGADDLDTISGGIEGQVLIIRPATSGGADTVTVRDGAGNILLDAAGNFAMDNVADTIMFIYDGSNWLELTRSDNA